MPDLFTLIRHWWKPILLLLLLSLTAIGVIVFTKRPEYRSVATAVPASNYSSDKARLFNNNIEQLYTALGTPDDLDLVVGTGKLDTVYLAVTAQFNLQDHYKMEEKGDAAKNKAAILLKKNSSVAKSEYGELKVSVWDTDKNLAPQLANAVMKQLQTMHQYLQNAGNEASLQALVSMKKQLVKEKEAANDPEMKMAIATRLADYDKLISEYQLILSNKSLALIVVENAKASDWPDRPKKLQWMLGTAVLALLFSLLLAAFLESRKKKIGVKAAVLNKTNQVFGVFAGLFLAALAAAVLYDSYYLIGIPFSILLLYAGWLNRSLVFFGLLFSLPISFEYNFTSALGTDIPDEILMLLTSGLFLVYALYNRKSISREIKTHPLIFLLTFLCSWMLVAILFSTHPLISVKYGLAKSWYLGAFVLAPLLIFTNKVSIRKAAILLAGSMLLITLIALVRHGLTGFSFASVNEAVSPFFRNHVNYSAMLVCLLSVWFAFYHLTKNKVQRRWILLVIGLSLAALFFSYARGAWLALVAGAFAFILIRKRKLVTAYLLFILLAIAAVLWLRHENNYLRFAHNYQRTIFHKDFGEHLVATYKLKDVSTAERFYRWIAGVRMISDQPLTGFGPNTFYENYKPYGVPAFKTWVSDNPEHSTVHNYFLLTVIEQGYPGLFFFLLLLGAMLWYAQRLWLRVNDPFYKAATMVTGVMLVMIITVNCLSDLIETDKVGSLFFLCLSMLVVVDLQTRKNRAVNTN